MKRKNLLIGISSLLLVSFLTTGCGKEIEVKNGSKVAVSIAGDKFTATEYYEKIKENNIATLIDMMDHSLLDEKYPTSDEEKESIDNEVKQIKNYYGEDSAFLSVIQQYFGATSEKELREKLSLEYKRNLAVTDYVKKNLKDDEINDYYKENIYGQVTASHILISVDADKDATDEEKEKAEKKALKKANEVIEKLNNGEDFAELAKEYSTDDGTKEKGGDLGTFEYEDMVSEFSDALKKLEVGEYTKEAVKTTYGYHIILKTAQEEKPELKDVEDKVREAVAKEKLAETSTLYYESLVDVREENKLSWNDDVLKKAYHNYMNNLINSAASNTQE